MENGCEIRCAQDADLDSEETQPCDRLTESMLAKMLDCNCM